MHTKHVLAPVATWYWPATQPVQPEAAATETVPTAQSEQIVEEAVAAYFPAPHESHVSLFPMMLLSVTPAAIAIFPAGQIAQVLGARPDDTLPDAQLVHDVEARFAANFPAAQPEQVD